MREEAVNLGAIAIGGENGADHEGEVHTSKAERLRAGFHGGHEQRGDKAPEHPTGPVHAVPLSCALDSRCASCFSPFNLSVIESAALIRPTCVNACGKLPRAWPLS